MSDYTAELSAALHAWHRTRDDGRDGIRVARVEVHDPYDSESVLVPMDLRESASTELAYLLRTESDAANDERPTAERDGMDSAGELRMAATHTAQRANSARRGRSRALEVPANARAMIAAIAAVASPLSSLVDEAVDPVVRDLRNGRIVALPRPDEMAVPDQRDVAEEVESAARIARKHLAAAIATLNELQDRMSSLQRTVTVGVTREDGSTLASEAIVEIRRPLMSNPGRFHVRVFAPAACRPVVVIGELSDNGSASITNSVEAVARAIAGSLLGGVAHDQVRWVQLYPAELFVSATSTSDSACSSADQMIDEVRFGEPFEGPEWGPIDHADLERLCGDSVRFWHAADYTSTALQATGVPLRSVDMKSRG